MLTDAAARLNGQLCVHGYHSLAQLTIHHAHAMQDAGKLEDNRAWGCINSFLHPRQSSCRFDLAKCGEPQPRARAHREQHRCPGSSVGCMHNSDAFP